MPVNKEENKMEYHKHKGVLSNGKLKLHLVSVQHKDKKAQIEHNKVINDGNCNTYNENNKPKKTNRIDNSVLIEFVKKKQDNNITFEIDDDGYIFVNLDTTNTKGLKLLFTRKEASKTSMFGKKKTIGLQFENLPAPAGKTCGGKYTLRKKY
jgi:hypothetical protein